MLAAMPGTAAHSARYLVQNDVRIQTPDGATIGALVVRPADAPARLPTALVFTIYADPGADEKRMRYAADRGYAAVTAYTRGKACSPNAIVPYEDDGRDADAVIGWIIKQSWRVYAVGRGEEPAASAQDDRAVRRKQSRRRAPDAEQRLSARQLRVDLLCHVKSVLDQAIYSDARWNGLNQRWYASGRAYRDIDAVAGLPNPWLHKWLRHPSYDAYWQAIAQSSHASLFPCSPLRDTTTTDSSQRSRSTMTYRDSTRALRIMW
jgi:uncharacterized protein